MLIFLKSTLSFSGMSLNNIIIDMLHSIRKDGLHQKSLPPNNVWTILLVFRRSIFVILGNYK